MNLENQKEREWMLWETEMSSYFYQKLDDDTIGIGRVLGDSPFFMIEDQLAGKKVRKVLPYCFAREMKDQKLREKVQAYLEKRPDLFELAGEQIEDLCLPKTLEEIGNYAFYNCKYLKKLRIGNCLKEIYGDAFMNCRRLSEIQIVSKAKEASIARSILMQLNQGVLLTFVEEGKEEPEASLFYPEYTEMYEEIGPAHIFAMNVEGEGYRARRCFREERVDFAAYDRIFEKAKATEQVKILYKMAIFRLLYPIELAEDARIRYEGFLKSCGLQVLEICIKEQSEDILSYLLDIRILSTEQVMQAIRLTNQEDWMNGTRILLSRGRQ